MISTINALFTNEHIAQMTYKWLSFGQNHQEYQRFTRWPKYIKLFLLVDQSSLVAAGSGGPKERISSFVDSLLPGQSRKNKSLASRTLHIKVISLKTRLFQMKQFKLRWTCVLYALAFPRKRESTYPLSPLRRTLSVKVTYPYFIFGRLNAGDLNRKLIFKK